MFLPSLHTGELWDREHNRIHHKFTNLAGRDYAYCPLSLEQYQSQSLLQRMFYRFHRSIWGHVTYYLITVWKRRLFFPRPSEIDGYNWKHVRDHLILAVWLGGLGYITAQSVHGLIPGILLGFVGPFLIWNFLGPQGHNGVLCRETHGK